MVRGSAVTQEEVSQLAKDLIAKGEKPTIGHIRELLGNRGSPNTISRYLKNWRDGEIDQIRQESELSSSIELVEPKFQQVETKKFLPASEGDVALKPMPVVADELTPVVSQEPVSPPKVISPPAALAAPAEDGTSSAPLAKSQSQQNHPHHRRDKPHKDHKNYPNHPHNGGGAPSPKPPQHQQNGQKHHYQNANAHQQKRDRPPVPRPVLSFEDSVPNVYVSENLDTLTTTQLIAKVRRLESILNKEVSRRERADSMARDAKEYAEAVKIQIGARINDIRQSMEMVIDSLQSQLKSMRENAEKDLRFYREALQKANEKLLK